MRNKLALHAGGEDVGFLLLMLTICEVGSGMPCVQEKNRSCNFYFHLAEKVRANKIRTEFFSSPERNNMNRSGVISFPDMRFLLDLPEISEQ